MVRQVNAKSRWRFVGQAWAVFQISIALFGMVTLGIYLFSFHSLVLYRYIDFWMFLLLLTFLFAGIALVVYVVILPGMMAFNVRQNWVHNNPFRGKLEDIEKKLDELLKGNR